MNHDLDPNESPVMEQKTQNPPQKTPSNTIKSLKSMHIAKKRADLKRIEKENMQLARRIYFIEPYIKVSTMEQKFQEHLQTSESLNKIKRKRL